MKLLIFLKVALGYENLDAIPFPKDQSADHEFPPRDGAVCLAFALIGEMLKETAISSIL